MAKVKRKVKRKVRVKQKVELVHKNDKTRVHRNTISSDFAPTPMPRSNGVVFKVKMRKK